MVTMVILVIMVFIVVMANLVVVNRVIVVMRVLYSEIMFVEIIERKSQVVLKFLDGWM